MLKQFCKRQEIIHETTVPYTSEQDGIAERKTEFKKMVISSGLSSDILRECILYACYSLNRIVHKKIEKTLFWNMEPLI